MPSIRHAAGSDYDLLVESRSDPEAFGVFFDRTERQVLAFFMRATGRADIAADLTAEVFAAALSSLGSYRPELGTPKGWLFGIARHQLGSLWERGAVEDRARRRLGMEPLILDDPALERVEELASGDGLVLELLNELPAEQREAIAGRVLEEHSYAALAESLRCSESVIRKRVSRGLQSLRVQLDGDTTTQEEATG
jgi:RNA polymerase sigma factor (sigma-70 family)